MTKRKTKQKASAGLSKTRKQVATKNKGSKAQQQKATAAMSAAVAAAAAGVASQQQSAAAQKQRAAPKKQKKAKQKKSAQQISKKTADASATADSTTAATAEPRAPLWWQMAALLPAARQQQEQQAPEQWQKQQRKKVKVKRGNAAQPPPTQQQQQQTAQKQQQPQQTAQKQQQPQQTAQKQQHLQQQQNYKMAHAQQQQQIPEQQQNKKKLQHKQHKPAAAAAARRAESPPPEQPNAKRRKVQVAAGTPTAAQLEEGRTLFAFDTNVVLGLYKSELPAAWEVLERGGGKRAQALIPLKVLLEVKSKAACRSGKYPVRAGAERALAVLAGMMRNHQCCRVQREDETYRAHPKHLASQRGDDAILDCLLHFSRVGAQVVLVTQDKGFIQRAQEHGLRTVTPQQLQAALELAVGGSSSGAGGGGGGSEEGSSQAVKRGAGAAAAAVVLQVPQPSMPLFPPGFGIESALASPAPAAPAPAPAPAAPWSERHAIELQSLLFDSSYQRQALGAAFPPFSQPLFAACAARLGQPLEAVLLAATQQLAGATVASLAGISATSPSPANLAQTEAAPARAGLLSPSWAAVAAGAGRSPWGQPGPRPLPAVSPLAGPGMPPWGQGWPQQRHHASAGQAPAVQQLSSGWGGSGFGADAAGWPPRADTAQWQPAPLPQQDAGPGWQQAQAQAQQWQAQQWQRQPSPSPEPWAEQQWRGHGAPVGHGGSAQLGGSWQEVRQTVQQQQQAQQQQQQQQQQQPQQQSVQQQQQPKQQQQQLQQHIQQSQQQHEQHPQQASRRQQQQQQQGEQEKQQPGKQVQREAPQPPPAERQHEQGQQEGAAWVPEMMRLVQNDAYREQVCGNRKKPFVRVAKHLQVPVSEVLQAYEEERLRQLRAQSKHVRCAEDGSVGAGEEAEAQGSDTPELQQEGLSGTSAATAAAQAAAAVVGVKHGKKDAKQPQRKQQPLHPATAAADVPQGGAEEGSVDKQPLHGVRLKQKKQGEQGKQVLQLEKHEKQVPQQEKQQQQVASQPPVDEQQLLARVRPLVLGALSALPGRQGSLREVQQAIAGCPSLSGWISGDMRRKVGGVSRWRTAAKQLLRSPSVAREVEHGGQLGGKVYQLAPCTLSLEW